MDDKATYTLTDLQVAAIVTLAVYGIVFLVLASIVGVALLAGTL